MLHDMINSKICLPPPIYGVAIAKIYFHFILFQEIKL